ncbi:hypothetical protein [Salipaludibacillus daqingensis]|uniref:hypothetical protein n=1 Tax=Salipaludibacillus daqingensis TaxID=3041001 RepID=UPI0024755E2D|nr:hypothetical protein [Salipaludibacillus daqingensis]
MSNTKKIFVFITFISLLVVIGLSLYAWIQLKSFYPASILMLFVNLSIFFHALNFRDPESGDKNEEMIHHIKSQSAKISYSVLVISAGLILFISEGVYNSNNIENIPLLTVVGLSIIVQPITEFLYSRKINGKR